ncbi:MAG: CoB--CoM heterodisulfide reductase iron-sulfur subunit B family protein [Thermoguttaceae bacterium]
MKYAFFPGCSLESTAWDFDRSTRAVCGALGIELEDIPNWVCCGSTPAHTTNASLAVALPVLNLQKAQRMNSPVMTACASCYARLRTANYKVTNDPAERKRAERITGKSYDGGVPVHHVLDVLVNHLGLETIRAAVRKPLASMRVACYYGCLLTRPPEVVAFDDPEHPTAMDDLVSALGAEPVDWPYKTECCGASLSMTNVDVVNRLGHRLISMAREAGAQCITVACPLCQVNLDLRQADAGAAHGELPLTPVLYITQLLGLALGLSPKELGIQALSVSAEKLLNGPHPNPLPKGEGTASLGAAAVAGGKS